MFTTSLGIVTELRDRRSLTPTGTMTSSKSEARISPLKVLLGQSSMAMVRHGGTVKVPMAERQSQSSHQPWFIISLSTKLRPDHFIVLKTTGTSTIKNLHIQNWPVHCFEITSASGTTITGLTLDNSAGNAPNSASDGLPAAHNTDGFDVSGSTNILITNTTVFNQDDCVAVTSGSNITVSNIVCDGSHGLSIGSVGGKSDNDVSDVLFTNSIVRNSQNGARIKTNSGTTGSVSNIEWSNIQVSNISTYGIDIQQDYLNGGPTGIILFGCILIVDWFLLGTPTNGVTITGITMSNITGTVQSAAQNYYILCGSGSCSDFDFTNIAITGGTDDSCNYTPTEGNFECA